MFINFSNHASTRWGVPQKQAAKKYGEIVDMQFPNVDPEATISSWLTPDDIRVPSPIEDPPLGRILNVF